MICGKLMTWKAKLNPHAAICALQIDDGYIFYSSLVTLQDLQIPRMKFNARQSRNCRDPGRIVYIKGIYPLFSQ